METKTPLMSVGDVEAAILADPERMLTILCELDVFDAGDAAMIIWEMVTKVGDAEALIAEGEFSMVAEPLGNDDPQVVVGTGVADGRIGYIGSTGRAVTTTWGNVVWYDATSLEDAWEQADHLIAEYFLRLTAHPAEVGLQEGQLTRYDHAMYQRKDS